MCWDFNEILADNEKQGGAPCPVRQIQVFHDVVREYGFSEMQLLDQGLRGHVGMAQS